MNYFHRTYLIAVVVLLGLSNATASQHYVTTTVSEALERLPQDQKLMFLDDSHLILKKNWPIVDFASSLINEHPLITFGGACIIGYYAWKGFWQTPLQSVSVSTNPFDTNAFPSINTQSQADSMSPLSLPSGICNDTGAACYRNAALQGTRFLAPEIHKSCQEKEEEQAELKTNQTFQDFKNFMLELSIPTQKVIQLPTDFPDFARLLNKYVVAEGKQDDASTILLGLGNKTLKEDAPEDDKKAQTAISTIMHKIIGITIDEPIKDEKKNLLKETDEDDKPTLLFTLRQNTDGTLSSLTDLIANSHTADKINWTTKAPTKNKETGKINDDGEYIHATQDKSVNLTGSKGLAFLIPVYKNQAEKYPIPEIPLSLKLENTLKSNKQENKDGQPKATSSYQLKSIVCHSGGLPGGHYIAYINHEGAWFCCNDSIVKAADIASETKIIQKNLKSSFAPYLAFYEKIEN